MPLLMITQTKNDVNELDINVKFAIFALNYLGFKVSAMKHNKQLQEQLEKVSPAIKLEMDWACAIVDKIDAILKRRGMPQRELAAIIGCNEAQITRWTRGFPNYTLASLAKLSEALGEPLIVVQ